MKSKMNILKRFLNVENYISKRDYTILFLISICAVIPSVISGNRNANLWLRVIDTLQNPLSNVLVFLGILLLLINIKRNICFNPLLYFRFSNYKTMLKNGLVAVFSSICSFYGVFVILAIAGSLLFSFGNYELVMYPSYQFNVLIYVLFCIFRNIVIYAVVGGICFLLSFVFKKNIFKYMILLIIIALYFLPYKYWKISKLYYFPIMFQAYLVKTDFSSFFIELSFSLIYIFIFSGCLNKIFYYVSKNRSDVNECSI